MTLEDAIKHCEEIAGLKYDEGNEARLQEQDKYADECITCAAEHRQLAEWLRKYQKIKKIYDNWNIDFGVWDYRAMNKIGKVLNGDVPDTNIGDMVSRQAAIDAIVNTVSEIGLHDNSEVARYGATFRQHEIIDIIKGMPSAQPERKWISCSNPPKHHKDVIVRGIEAIGNVTVHKVMQWDVDTWRPTDYVPSVMWKEWSEI